MKNLLLVLFCLVAFSGCVSKVKDPNFIVEDSDIYDTLEFVNMAKRTKDDGLTEIQAVFKNYTKSNEKFAYRVDWFDEDGFVIDSIMSKWKVVEVEAKRNLVINALSPSIKAKDYKIRMQFISNDDKLRNNSAIYEYQGK